MLSNYPNIDRDILVTLSDQNIENLKVINGNVKKTLDEYYWRLKVCNLLDSDNVELCDKSWKEYYKFLIGAKFKNVLEKKLPLNVCKKYYTDIRPIFQNGRIDVLEWLKNNKIHYLAETFGELLYLVTLARANGYEDVLEWLKNDDLFVRLSSRTINTPIDLRVYN